MSARKKKNRQRGHQGTPPNELLDELSSLRDLLGSEELGDIPLLDQVAGSAAKPPAPAPQRAPEQEPLDESELPILFSPVDEELPEEYPAELNEADRALLRPLQDLPDPAAEPASVMAPLPTTKTATQPPVQPPSEQQQELFGAEDHAPPPENPFLPAHIRARLTGGRVPKSEAAPLAPAATASAPVNAAEGAAPLAASEALTPATDTAAPDQPTPDDFSSAAATAADGTAEPEVAEQAATPDERAKQRQQLIDRLVARQLPELERQLRARIELMVDELEAKR
ncbi:hypothetical protein [Microbulbifer sp. SAOS-129_SWC]|uniref:hypothetical protein n=1 Tax=Microbulbifer sp. SAOS-129_SWC TaxID=3145235 RepID=UPI00321798D6